MRDCWARFTSWPGIQRKHGQLDGIGMPNMTKRAAAGIDHAVQRRALASILDILIVQSIAMLHDLGYGRVE